MLNLDYKLELEEVKANYRTAKQALFEKPSHENANQVNIQSMRWADMLYLIARRDEKLFSEYSGEYSRELHEAIKLMETAEKEIRRTYSHETKKYKSRTEWPEGLRNLDITKRVITSSIIQMRQRSHLVRSLQMRV